MFERIRRAKSFIHKSRRDEERELDLTESSHLKRNIVINNAVLEKQKALSGSREILCHPKAKLLQKQTSRSHEHLNDTVLEQMRQRNFGDSYSKKDVQQLKTQEFQGFKRGQAPYVSQRAFHRRSYVGEAEEKRPSHKTCGDVVVNNFDRKNKMYWSERLPKPPSVSQSADGSQLLSGSSGDFLLQRRGIGMLQDTKERNPPFVPKPKLTRRKSDLLEMSGLRSLFQKLKPSHSTEDAREVSDSGTSTISSTGSFTYVQVRHQGERDGRQRKEEEGGSESGSCSNVSTASSSGTNTRKKSTESHEIRVNGHREELSRKRQHSATRRNFDRSRPVYSSERTLRESRKKSFDRLRHATDQKPG